MANPSPLVAIPLEIQLQICEQLMECPAGDVSLLSATANTWQSTLDNFAAIGHLGLACKHFQRITMAYLYSGVTARFDDPTGFMGLIRLFTRFPDRAGFVQELAMLSDADFSNMMPLGQWTFLYDEAKRLGLRTNDEPRPISVASLMIDVLLSRVPNIRKLVICVPRHKAFRINLDYGIRLPQSLIFASLKHLDIQPPRDPSAPGIRKAPVTALLRHAPALTHLRVGRYVRKPDAIIQSPLPELRDLHLEHAPHEDVADIARLCPRLERFRLGRDPSSILAGDLEYLMLESDFMSPRFFVEDILRSLLPLRPTLRNIDIDWNLLQAPAVEDMDLVSRFSALQSLRLVIPKWPAGDTDQFISKLPPGLESLCLGGKDAPIGNIAREVSEGVRSGQLPKLKCFEYTLASEVVNLWRNETVAFMFEGTDVECVERPYFPGSKGFAEGWVADPAW